MIKLDKLRSNKGFTIVELLVVIAMLAILTSVSIGGYEHSLKRAAIENDKALVKQLNRVVENYGIYEHNEEKISKALIEEFGDHIEVQSYKFGYDIYCNVDLCEFDLLQQVIYTDNDKYISITDYLNYQNDNIEQERFKINENYSKTTNDTKSTYSYINKNDKEEYELEVGIHIIHNDDQSMSPYPHTITLNDLVIIDEGNEDINLNYTITTISEVKYDYYNYINEILDNQTITFYYPGRYQLNISDGSTNKIINISVYNLNFNTATIQPTYEITLPVTSLNSNDSYNLYLPIFFYINIYDYISSEQQYLSYDWSNYSENYRNALVNSGRLIVKNNDEIYTLTKYRNNHCVCIPELTVGEYTYEIIYYYQGYNGRWSTSTQIFNIIIKENGNVDISRQ